MFGSGIPNPNITDETGIRIAEALENLQPEEIRELPEVTAEDAGKILGVTDSGKWDKVTTLFGTDHTDGGEPIPIFDGDQLAMLADIPVTVVGDKLMFGDKEIAFVEKDPPV